MAADVQITFTPDSDPNVVSGQCVFLVNGTQVGTVPFGPTATMVAYSTLAGAPVLNNNDNITGNLVTTDNQNPPQSSPPIPFPPVTIQAAQPPPQGVTNVSSKQVGAPDGSGGALARAPARK
jgi:hypothetical protein